MYVHYLFPKCITTNTALSMIPVYTEKSPNEPISFQIKRSHQQARIRSSYHPFDEVFLGFHAYLLNSCSLGNHLLPSLSRLCSLSDHTSQLESFRLQNEILHHILGLLRIPL